MNLPTIDSRTCVVRRTDARKGRTRTVAPGLTATRHLHYGRIILDPGDAPCAVDPGTHETGLVCLKGQAVVTVGSNRYPMAPYDAIYLPRETPFEVVAAEVSCDFAELSAHVDGSYPLQFVA